MEVVGDREEVEADLLCPRRLLEQVVRVVQLAHQAVAVSRHATLPSIACQSCELGPRPTEETYAGAHPCGPLLSAELNRVVCAWTSSGGSHRTLQSIRGGLIARTVSSRRASWCGGSCGAAPSWSQRRSQRLPLRPRDFVRGRTRSARPHFPRVDRRSADAGRDLLPDHAESDRDPAGGTGARMRSAAGGVSAHLHGRPHRPAHVRAVVTRTARRSLRRSRRRSRARRS